MSCPHDISEQDVVAHADGLCPLCLAADVNLLSIALERILVHLAPDDDAEHVSTVGLAREIALAALNSQ